MPPDEEAAVVPLTAEPAAVVALVVVVPAAEVPLGALVPAGALVALPAGRVAAAAVGAVVAAAPVVGAVVAAGFGVSVALLPPHAARMAAAALAATPPRNPRRVNLEIRYIPSCMVFFPHSTPCHGGITTAPIADRRARASLTDRLRLTFRHHWEKWLCPEAPSNICSSTQ